MTKASQVVLHALDGRAAALRCGERESSPASFSIVGPTLQSVPGRIWRSILSSSGLHLRSRSASIARLSECIRQASSNSRTSRIS